MIRSDDTVWLWIGITLVSIISWALACTHPCMCERVTVWSRTRTNTHWNHWKKYLIGWWNCLFANTHMSLYSSKPYIQSSAWVITLQIRGGRARFLCLLVCLCVCVSACLYKVRKLLGNRPHKKRTHTKRKRRDYRAHHQQHARSVPGPSACRSSWRRALECARIWVRCLGTLIVCNSLAWPP